MVFNVEEAEILVADFNNFIESKLNSFLTGELASEEELALPVAERVKNYMDQWSSRQISELKNSSPREYLDSFNDLGELLQLFEHFSNNCIELLPDIFPERLYAFGDEALKQLALRLKADVVKKDMADFNNMSQEDNYQMNVILGVLNAIIHLGERAASLCEDIIGLMANCHTNNELFLELASQALKNMGTGALMKVVDYINNSESITTREEYMLMALSDTGYQKGNDEIYMCLKNSFRRMENKLIGAVLLGDYGDGRAVPMLRKFAMDHKGFIDKNVYFGILGAIDKLGGEVQDLLPSSIPQL